MKRLTTCLLIASLLAPGVLLGAACCHASVWAESLAWTQTDRCCTDGTACGLSAESCESGALHERQALSTRLSDESFTLRRADALASFSPLIIRSWWARKVRVASTDPPESFHPVVSLPLRL